MTRALYHENGLQLQFQSVVSDQQGQEVALDATAFYPESGGQSADTGILRWEATDGQTAGAARVLDTRKDKATGIIWHTLELTEGQLPTTGTAVSGEVDEARRWRHMQRHTGEHLLAQAFARVNPAFQVVAVSMLGPDCHLDLLGEPTETDVQAAETLLREQLGRGELTLETPILPEDELANYPLRRETKVHGTVRLVIFRDQNGEFFDVSACGGTHVPRGAMCAPVVVLRTERVKGDLTRVTFRTGEEASEYLAQVYRQSRTLAQSLSVPVDGLPERFAALSAERDTLKADLAAVREALAQKLLEAAPVEMVGGVPVRFLALPDADLLMPLLSQNPAGSVAAVVTDSGRCGIVSGLAEVRAGEVLRSALAVTGGKGGGKPELAQGTTEQPTQFLEAVRATLKAIE